MTDTIQVYPTQTIYTFEQDGIQLNLTVCLIITIKYHNDTAELN